MNYPCQKIIGVLPAEEGVAQVYQRLLKRFGTQNWWPADTPFEVIIGAILTQAVSWSNVEKAIDNLKQEKLLTPVALMEVEEERLAKLIKPSGYYRMKARKLKAFLQFLFDDFNGQLKEMFKVPLEGLRPRLLNVYGIGPETADSILLYAGQYPVFVVDAYTMRIFQRLGYIRPKTAYHSLQQFIVEKLTGVAESTRGKISLYNEYHALLVVLGKEICRKSQPDCHHCPLGSNP